MDTVIQFRGTVYEDGYGMIAQKVMRDKSISPTAKAIYAYLCSFAGSDRNGDRTAFPGVGLMMDDLGIKSEDTYYKYRKELVEAGYITIEKQRGRDTGKFDRNLYIINAIQQPQETVNEPYPKSSGTVQPHPKSSSTANPSTVNRGTNNISSNSISIKKENERKKDATAPDILSESFETLKRQSEKMLVSENETAAPFLTDMFARVLKEHRDLISPETIHEACNEWGIRYMNKYTQSNEIYVINSPVLYFVDCFRQGLANIQAERLSRAVNKGVGA